MSHEKEIHDAAVGRRDADRMAQGLPCIPVSMPEPMRVRSVTPYWGSVNIYRKTYLGAHVLIGLPCGHDIKIEIHPSCTYTLSGEEPAQRRYHTASEIDEALREGGCKKCGTLYRPLDKVIDTVHKRLMKEARRA